MTEDFEKLEAEIDAMLVPLSPRLAVEPEPAAIARTNAAVRHELNENWLGDQPTPAIPVATLRRVRAAVNNELKAPATSFARIMIISSLAAAAIIAITIGLLQYNPIVKPLTVSSTVDLDLFVQAAEKTLTQDPFTAAADMDLDDIENTLNNLAAGTGNEFDILDDIGNQIDELFIEPEWLETNMTGAMG